MHVHVLADALVFRRAIFGTAPRKKTMNLSFVLDLFFYLQIWAPTVMRQTSWPDSRKTPFQQCDDGAEKTDEDAKHTDYDVNFFIGCESEAPVVDDACGVLGEDGLNLVSQSDSEGVES